MKKSEILKAVKKEMKENTFALCYICNNIKNECDLIGEELDEPFNDLKQENGRILINWIEDSIKTSPESEKFGVAAWLYDNGFIDDLQYKNQVDDKDVSEYRLLWLNDMIAYWESQGD
jgi:hypothetical protein